MAESPTTSVLARAAAHRHRLIRRHHAEIAVHGEGRVAVFNRHLAVWITDHVGSMWCAYLFTAIALFGAVFVVTNNLFLTLVVNLISQTFLQLVLLPIIIVGQNVISEASDRRAEADHETLGLLHELNVTQLEILTTIRDRRRA